MYIFGASHMAAVQPLIIARCRPTFPAPCKRRASTYLQVCAVDIHLEFQIGSVDVNAFEAILASYIETIAYWPNTFPGDVRVKLDLSSHQTAKLCVPCRYPKLCIYQLKIDGPDRSKSLQSLSNAVYTMAVHSRDNDIMRYKTKCQNGMEVFGRSNPSCW